ncbi:hypothetical protein [Enterocloster clostridioformis]|nr:hypothetical protein [Enterocloster clostridioformis]
MNKDKDGSLSGIFMEKRITDMRKEQGRITPASSLDTPGKICYI